MGMPAGDLWRDQGPSPVFHHLATASHGVGTSCGTGLLFGAPAPYGAQRKACGDFQGKTIGNAKSQYASRQVAL
jgi:hypothetical protein